jgi:hypothetical protein
VSTLSRRETLPSVLAFIAVQLDLLIWLTSSLTELDYDPFLKDIREALQLYSRYC